MIEDNPHPYPFLPSPRSKTNTRDCGLIYITLFGSHVFSKSSVSMEIASRCFTSKQLYGQQLLFQVIREACIDDS